MIRYWHHAESECVGVFTADMIEEFDRVGGCVGGEPIDEIDEDNYNRLAKLYDQDTRSDHNDFYDNLEFAQRGEELVAELLQNKFTDFKILDYNEDSECDIVAEVGGKRVTIEVKEDVRTKDTGNVVIECESRGKPSGIMTTKADFWVFRVHQDDGILNILFKIKDLKQAVRDRRFHNKRQMPHTDSKNVLYFFRLDTLREYETMVL